MKNNNKSTMILITICCHGTLSFATNFNDGVSPDGPIQDQIQRDTNIEFITQKALARSKIGKNKILKNNAGIGNIIVGPKANLKGAIIVNQSENVDAAVISD